MVERDHWWPVALASAVGPTPLACWLLGEPAHADVPPYTVASTPDGRPFVADYPAWQPRASAGAQ
jgi:hypothetical protein